MISQFLAVHVFLLLHKNTTSIIKIVFNHTSRLTGLGAKMSRIQSTKQLKKKQTHLGFQIFVHWDWLLIWQPLSRFHKLHLRSCNKEITNDEEQKITPRRSGLETSATSKSMLLFIFLTFRFKLSLPLHCKWVCHISFMGFNTLLAMF